MMMRTTHSHRIHHNVWLLVMAVAVTRAQVNLDPGASEIFQPPSDFAVLPDPSIDFPGCYSDLVTADVNGDGLVKKDEYLGFIQEYGKRKCIENPALTLQQRIAFNLIACGCGAEESSAINCCLDENAEIRTAGALNAARTAEQENYLTSACRITDETLPPFNCPPTDGVRATAPLPPLPPFPPPLRTSDDGFDIPWWYYLIAALLLLMLLCCCCACVWRKPREIEQIDDNNNPVVPPKRGDVEQPLPPVPLLGVEPPAVAAPLAGIVEGDEEDEEEGRKRQGGGPVDEEYDEEEEGRKRRGGGPVDEEYDEEGRKRYGAGRLPPPEHLQPGFQLRPVPPKEKEEDPAWDHPGRPFDYPKDPDEMSAQELEHYVPDGGVYLPERPTKDPVEYNPQWERSLKPEEDDKDTRKHRLQSGLGPGEIWDRIDDESTVSTVKSFGNQYDWVMNSALGVLQDTEQNGLTEVDEEPDDELGYGEEGIYT